MKTPLSISMLVISITSFAQFNTQLATAKAEYSKGNLEASRFAMQQMITELDIQIGKDILALLPTKLEALNYDVKSDNVTANAGFAGSLVSRKYSSTAKEVSIDIMSNSPLISSLNAILSVPFLANAGDGSQKVIKIANYKSILQKSINTEKNQENFTIQIPLSTTLITMTVDNSNEAEVLKWANMLPIEKIAKMFQ